MRERTLRAELLGTFAAGLALLVLGCSEKGSDDKPNTPNTGTVGEWVTLIDAQWTLPAEKEGYTCARATIPEDMYVRSYRAIAPLGTHHTLVTMGADSTGETADTVFECSAGTNGPAMLFGSGVGTDPVDFPDGVAMKLTKGEKILLNLHLFNIRTTPLTGVSGIEVLRVDPADVEHEAEIVLAGKIAGLTVVPGVSTQTGSCQMSHDVTVFAVFPHMHQLGTHLKAVAEPVQGDARVLVDAPYSFEEQIYYPVSPSLQLRAGDPVSVECQYDNPGTETVVFGDSSLMEMCFAGLYRYPKAEGNGFVCGVGSGSRPILEGPPCVEVGAPGNEVGVGKHCTAGLGECGPTASICLADYTQGEFGNFCTKMCTDDASCGTGARCGGGSTGSRACMPIGCEIVPAEAGAGDAGAGDAGAQ